MWGDFVSTDPTAPTDPAERAKYLQEKVMDHCPVYADYMRGYEDICEGDDVAAMQLQLTELYRLIRLLMVRRSRPRIRS